MKIIPLENRVLLKPTKKEETTNFGFLLSATSEDRAQTGIVLEMSENITKLYSSLTIGDRVIFNKYAGCDVEYDDELYVLIDIKDIIGKMTQEVHHV